MAVFKVINNHSKSKASLKRILDYVLQPCKTSETLCSCHGDIINEEISAENIYQEFFRVKDMFEKEEGRMYQHGTISFHKNEHIKPEEVLSFARELVEKLYPDHQVLVAVHTDRDHLHAHFIVNTVNYQSGKKLHWNKSDLQKAKNISDALCLEHGYTITQRGKRFDLSSIKEGTVSAWSKDTYHMIKSKSSQSYLADCVEAVNKSLSKCSSSEAFISAMNENGWDVIWKENRKHVVFIDSQGHKVRDSNLSKTFHMDISKESLAQRFSMQKEVERKKRRRM